ncbi:XkdF-like putative serine protease domain-containing protein [Methanobrevibacter sp.]|uniref:XkdF-like putative serine protease domain-containing protein n=1 Tax=Methanobrevibacter sp. TaxID=66852 RepID=UPI00389009A3
MIKDMAVKSDDQFLFTAPVMIPDKPDCDYERGEEPFTAEEIRFFKESFQDYQIIDKNHQVFKDLGSAKSVGDPVDSFLLNEETTYRLVTGGTETYPAGTWMLTSNVTDPTTQQEIDDGILTGYSLSVHREDVGRLIKKYMATKSSGGQLIHDIPNPNAITVSIVGKPCQSGSKQCKLNGSDVMSDDKKTLDKIRDILGGDKPEYATKSDLDALAEQIKEEHEGAMKSLSEEMAVAMGTAIKEAFSEVGAIKSKDDDDDDDAGAEGSGDGQTEGSGDNKPNPEDDDEPKKKPKKKDGSKQGKVHNGATKSDNNEDLDTYAFLGRNPDGTSKNI